MRTKVRVYAEYLATVGVLVTAIIKLDVYEKNNGVGKAPAAAYEEHVTASVAAHHAVSELQLVAPEAVYGLATELVGHLLEKGQPESGKLRQEVMDSMRADLAG